MTTNQRIFPLTEVEVESGVNDAGEGFITLRAKGTMKGEPILLVGQLEPNRLRTQAMHFLEAAEAADTDAALFGFIREMEPDHDEALKKAAGFIEALRNYRGAGELPPEGSEAPEGT